TKTCGSTLWRFRGFCGVFNRRRTRRRYNFGHSVQLRPDDSRASGRAFEAGSPCRDKPSSSESRNSRGGARNARSANTRSNPSPWCTAGTRPWSSTSPRPVGKRALRSTPGSGAWCPDHAPDEVVAGGIGDLDLDEVPRGHPLLVIQVHQPVDFRRVGEAARNDGVRFDHLVDQYRLAPSDAAGKAPRRNLLL